RRAGPAGLWGQASRPAARKTTPPGRQTLPLPDMQPGYAPTARRIRAAPAADTRRLWARSNPAMLPAAVRTTNRSHPCLEAEADSKVLPTEIVLDPSGAGFSVLGTQK